MTKPTSRTCKARSCRKKFETTYNHPVCSYKCASEYSTYLRERKEKKEGVVRRRKIKVMKEKIKTLSDHKKELQILVNKFVRMRDSSRKCISCDRELRDTKGKGGFVDASHFWSLGGNPSVRFDLDNIHSACIYCNRDLHGNLLEYRPRLIKRIGQKRFDELEARRSVSNKQNIPDIISLKRLFKLKIKHYEQEH